MGGWKSSTLRSILWLLSTGTLTDAIDVNFEDDNSIKSAASTIAYDMMTYYTGNQSGGIPGLLPSPYYWWEAGAMFGSLINYWYYTGDRSYNDVVSQALLFQVGPDSNFMPPNQTSSLGNDDQAFWGLSAMTAAEVSFPNPPADQPQWLALAQGVFNSQVPRWSLDSCDGGLKWQIYSFNTGYDYRNSISNGCFFNLGARLGAYTQNATYFKWANKAWEWSVDIGLISQTYEVFDGTEDTTNCTTMNPTRWSYNMGVYLLGAAVMWNQTTGASQRRWGDRVNGLLSASSYFFNNASIMTEICEASRQCNTDQQSFKAYTSRWMAATMKVAPWTTDIIKPYLNASAIAAAKICSGGDGGQQCGMVWTTGQFDGWVGVGQQMSALEVIQSSLIGTVQGPLSNTTGGTSQGDPSAGTTGTGTLPNYFNDPITTSDKAGAYILTVMLLVGTLGGAWLLTK